MRVQFVEKVNGPERLVCDAEVVFDQEEPLLGMKLVGFALWRSADGGLHWQRAGLNGRLVLSLGTFPPPTPVLRGRKKR